MRAFQLRQLTCENLSQLLVQASAVLRRVRALKWQCQCDRAATCAWSVKLALYSLRYCYYARMAFMCAANALS